MGAYDLVRLAPVYVNGVPRDPLGRVSDAERQAQLRAASGEPSQRTGEAQRRASPAPLASGPNLVVDPLGGAR